MKMGQGAPGGEATVAAAVPAKHKRWLPRTVRHVAELLVVGFLVEYFVVPQIGGTHKAIHVLSSVNPFLPLVALGLEVCSLLAYFALTRALLPRSSDPGWATVSRVEMSSLALSHCLPGGNALGYSLAYRLLTKAGVRGSDAGFALATQGLGSGVMLNVIFWAALLISLPFYGFQPLYLSVALAGILFMSAIAGLVVLFTRGNKKALAVVEGLSARLPFLSQETLPRLFSQLVSRTHELSKDKRQMGVAISLAAANWLCDAASLFVFVGAFGHWVNPVGVLIAYGVANILAAIPITPAGLGVVETALSGILVGFGTPRTIAIWGVLGYRLVNFWLPIPTGGLAYLSIRVHPPAGDQAGLSARREVWKARWRSAVELFGGETPEPPPATTLPGIVAPEEAGGVPQSGDPRRQAPEPKGPRAGSGPGPAPDQAPGVAPGSTWQMAVPGPRSPERPADSLGP